MNTVILPISGYYTAKDQLKANECNKFIGQGSASSSTNRYRKAYAEQANCGAYEDTDKVFISVEGARRNRLPLNTAEVLLAVNANASIVADTAYNRDRSYNVGERELCKLLRANNYIDTEFVYGSLWEPIGKVKE